jgi:hypothetical protein
MYGSVTPPIFEIPTSKECQIVVTTHNISETLYTLLVLLYI